MKPCLIGTPVDSAIKELGAIAEIRVNFSGPLSSHRKQKGQINSLASIVGVPWFCEIRAKREIYIGPEGVLSNLYLRGLINISCPFALVA